MNLVDLSKKIGIVAPVVVKIMTDGMNRFLKGENLLIGNYDKRKVFQDEIYSNFITIGSNYNFIITRRRLNQGWFDLFIINNNYPGIECDNILIYHASFNEECCSQFNQFAYSEVQDIRSCLSHIIETNSEYKSCLSEGAKIDVMNELLETTTIENPGSKKKESIDTLTDKCDSMDKLFAIVDDINVDIDDIRHIEWYRKNVGADRIIELGKRIYNIINVSKADLISTGIHFGVLLGLSNYICKISNMYKSEIALYILYNLTLVDIDFKDDKGNFRETGVIADDIVKDAAKIAKKFYRLI